MSIRVVIVDDSALIRKIIQARLARDTRIEVVGAASDAREARGLIKALNPDVITLDIEMPGMDGLTFLEKIMELRPTPVIIVSGSTQQGTQTAARALQLGAISCYAKGDRYGVFPDDDCGKLAALVHEAAAVNLKQSGNPAPRRAVRKIAQPGATDLIAIGSSTGGVEALHRLLGGFPADCPPTLIVQHVNANFAPAIARSLDSACNARVKIAQSDMRLEKGTIYFAPGGDRHLKVGKMGMGGLRSVLRKGEPINGHQPSVDALFSSVAEICGMNATGILLTGMGCDGAEGLLNIVNAGGRTIAQDESTSVVFGMPRKAIELGAVKNILPLDHIAPALFQSESVAA